MEGSPDNLEETRGQKDTRRIGVTPALKRILATSVAVVIVLVVLFATGIISIGPSLNPLH